MDARKRISRGRNHKAEDVIKDHIDKPLIVALKNWFRMLLKECVIIKSPFPVTLRLSFIESNLLLMQMDAHCRQTNCEIM
jgi:hypothetical protein